MGAFVVVSMPKIEQFVGHSAPLGSALFASACGCTRSAAAQRLRASRSANDGRGSARSRALGVDGRSAVASGSGPVKDRAVTIFDVLMRIVAAPLAARISPNGAFVV